MQSPSRAALSVYPNPFNASTEIRYSVPVDGPVELSMYDVAGRRVVTLVRRAQPAGSHQAWVEGSNLSSGIYYCVLSTDGGRAAERLVMVK